MTPSEWETFYVIVGSSAAALTGLQFVVVALSADVSIGGGNEMEIFATPTVVHFCSVLLIAATLSVPRLPPAGVSACLAALGAIGLSYTVWVTLRATGATRYQPVLEDWIFHSILPICGYATLFVAGIAAASHEGGALYVVALTALLLLLVGIHNAWDAAVYIAQAKHADRHAKSSVAGGGTSGGVEDAEQP